MKDRIKKVRTDAGLTMARFAEKLKSSVPTISLYESGKRIPSDAVLKLISKEFSVSYAWLKTGEGPMADPVPDEDTLDRLTDAYQNLPDRLKSLVDALAQMTPEWYKELDRAFTEIENRKKRGETD